MTLPFCCLIDFYVEMSKVVLIRGFRSVDNCFGGLGTFNKIGKASYFSRFLVFLFVNGSISKCSEHKRQLFVRNNGVLLSRCFVLSSAPNVDTCQEDLKNNNYL